eukprot:gene14535-13198_t
MPVDVLLLTGQRAGSSLDAIEAAAARGGAADALRLAGALFMAGGGAPEAARRRRRARRGRWGSGPARTGESVILILGRSSTPAYPAAALKCCDAADALPGDQRAGAVVAACRVLRYSGPFYDLQDEGAPMALAAARVRELV